MVVLCVEGVRLQGMEGIELLGVRRRAGKGREGQGRRGIEGVAHLHEREGVELLEVATPRQARTALAANVQRAHVRARRAHEEAEARSERRARGARRRWQRADAKDVAHPS